MPDRYNNYKFLYANIRNNMQNADSYINTKQH
jgi:hypothetical protein